MAKEDWNRLQDRFSRCTLCSKELPHKNVDCPPGKLYPTAARIPASVRVLFVGVAPPRKNQQFYSDPNDGLAVALFKILTDLGWPCSNVDGFLGHGFFFSHTAKCAIRGTWKPCKPVSLFCSSQYLKREIELLRPKAVCWLSKNVGYPVAKALAKSWDDHLELEFGRITPVEIGGRRIHLVATMWPGRGNEKMTKMHLEMLFKAIKVKGQPFE